ncbi:MAG: TonB-dependent receptor [Bryobacteraceae bacterium]|nr:TonB-dependent receptor [Bryobacteraceae bacterium]
MPVLACLLVLNVVGRAQDTTGSITGSVLDGQTGRPIPGVKISIDGQTGQDLVTDTDGKFQIKISPGSYKIRFMADNYLETTVEAVEVKLGEATDSSTILTAKGTVTTVDVVEKVGAVESSAEASLGERKLSAVVSDSISNDEIKKTVASDAAGAIQKVTGVSIVDNGYVYVRGLGERYSSTMLNSAMIPTTEPEKRVVPLDLFPAGMIENIKILKTYTPDLPGEFSGGLVQMTTVEFPTAKTFRVSAQYGYNTRTTRERFLTYPGGSRDAFGFDDGTRSLPAAIPERRLIPGAFSEQEMQGFGRAFSNNWEPSVIDSMRPSQSYSMVGGGTFGRIGIVGALTFANKPQFQSELQRYLRQEGTRPFVFTNYEDFRGYSEAARLGGVLNLALRLSANNKLVFRNTMTRDTEKEAREFGGLDGGVDTIVQSQRLRWIERGLLSTGVEGDHSFPGLGNSLFKWQYTYSSSERDEPDLRETFRGQLPNGQYTFLSFGSSGLRFFNDLKDRIHEPQAEFSKPFFKGAVTGLWKLGFRATLRERDFQARRFRFIPIRQSTLDFFLPSNQLFAPANIRPDGFQITEFTRATDRYDASMDIYAGYAMVDMGIGTRWRIVGGVRVEDADIRVVTLDPLVPNARAQLANLANRDPMPGVNLIYALSSRQNLRFSVSRTVSRPDFRELSPFDFNNVLGGFVAQGNPNLVRARVTNFDARWEWFLGGNQVVAASVFVKDFTDPIESTVIPANDLRQTYVNAKGATNSGIELEFRKGLASISPKLKDFAIQSNFTFVDSNIEIKESDAALLTTRERPLLGQSRYLFNAVAEFARPSWRSNGRFYANYVSRRITDVGTFGLPDIYQQGNTFLDFVWQVNLTEDGKWNVRFNAENLRDNHYHWMQGDILQRSFRLGRTYSVGVGYTIF